MRSQDKAQAIASVQDPVGGDSVERVVQSRMKKSPPSSVNRRVQTATIIAGRTLLVHVLRALGPWPGRPPKHATRFL